MQEFDHIEALWAKHTVDVRISADEMLKQAKKDVNNIRTKSLLNIIGMALCILAFAAIWLFYDFTSIAAQLGLSIIIIAVLVSTIVLYNNHRVISQKDFTENPTSFLQQLKIYQLQRHQLYNKMLWFYVAALTVGSALYFSEILTLLSPWQQGIALFFTFGWIIFCSTLVRKAVIKKENERIALLIEKFERISNQFKDVE